MPTASTINLQADFDPSVSSFGCLVGNATSVIVIRLEGAELLRIEWRKHPRCCMREAANNSRRILASKWSDIP